MDLARKRVVGGGAESRDPDPLEEDREILDFFGQLWFVPDSSSTLKPRVRRGRRRQPEFWSGSTR
jgi:hypothetical protein